MKLESFTKNPLYFALAVIVLAILFGTAMQKCGDGKQVEKNEGRLTYAINMDSLNTVYSLRTKRALDSLAAFYEKRLAEKQVIYIEAKERDRVSDSVYAEEKEEYAQAPTVEQGNTVIAACDTALASKNERIALLEDRIIDHIALIEVKDSTISVIDDLLVKKNATILDLREGYSEAIDDLEKRNSRNTVLSVGVGYGTGIDFKPKPYLGVQLGWKLIEF